MDWLRKILSSPGSDRGMAARRHERIVTQGVLCSLGPIVDLSRSGARVLSPDKPVATRGTMLSLQIGTPTQRLTVSARVVWSRRVGPGWHMGVQFVGVTPAVEAGLEELARFGFISGAGARPGGNSGAESGANSGANSGASSEGASGGASGASAGGSSGGAPRPPLRAAVHVEDLYAVLGVDRHAPEQDIHSAYRRLARKLHPDINPDPRAAERFTLVSKAYSVLKDPVTRSRYDTLLGRAA